MFDLKDRVALVTGASRGIGRAIALQFAELGATVAINYNSSQAAADEVIQLIQEKGGKAAAFQGDVASLAVAEALVKQTLDTFGKIDILVNNAGITRDNLIAMMKEDDWNSVIDTNLKGTWNCIKAISRSMMRQRYGRIINITSVVGILGQAGQSNYSASKAGIIGLTKSVARELAPRNITVNAIAPGFINTDIIQNMTEDMIAKVDAAIPLGKRGEPEEVAYAAAFLASDQAAYITGQTLSVDGGLAMH